MGELDIVPFRRLLDRVVVAARCHWREIALPVALPLVTCGALFTGVQVRWLDSLARGDEAYVSGSVALLLLLATVVLTVYAMAFWVLAVGSIRAVYGEPMELWQAWRLVARPRVFATLAMTLGLGVTSLLCCLAPALYVVPMLSFVLPVMVREGKLGIAAIRRSRELASFSPTGQLRHNCWLQIVVLAAVGATINYALALSIQLPFVIAQQVITVREVVAGTVANVDEMSAQLVWLQLPANMLGGVVTAVSWMYLTFGIALLYQETVRRKEAPDLIREVGFITGAEV